MKAKQDPPGEHQNLEGIQALPASDSVNQTTTPELSNNTSVSSSSPISEANDEELLVEPSNELLESYKKDKFIWSGSVTYKTFANKNSNNFMLTVKNATLKIGEETFGFTIESEDKSAFRLTRMVMGRSGFLFEVSEFLEKYKEKTDKRSQFYNPYINEIEGLLTQNKFARIIVIQFTPDRFSNPGFISFLFVSFNSEEDAQAASKFFLQQVHAAYDKTDPKYFNYHELGTKIPATLVQDKGYQVTIGYVVLLESSMGIYKKKESAALPLKDGFRYSIIKNCEVSYKPTFPQFPEKNKEIGKVLVSECCLQYQIDFSHRDSNCKTDDLNNYICVNNFGPNECVPEVRKMQKTMISSCKGEKKAALESKKKIEINPPITIPGKVEDELIRRITSGEVTPIPIPVPVDPNNPAPPAGTSPSVPESIPPLENKSENNDSPPPSSGENLPAQPNSAGETPSTSPSPAPPGENPTVEPAPTGKTPPSDAENPDQSKPTPPPEGSAGAGEAPPNANESTPAQPEPNSNNPTPEAQNSDHSSPPPPTGETPPSDNSPPSEAPTGEIPTSNNSPPPEAPTGEIPTSNNSPPPETPTSNNSPPPEAPTGETPEPSKPPAQPSSDSPPVEPPPSNDPKPSPDSPTNENPKPESETPQNVPDNVPQPPADAPNGDIPADSPQPQTPETGPGDVAIPPAGENNAEKPITPGQETQPNNEVTAPPAQPSAGDSPPKDESSPNDDAPSSSPTVTNDSAPTADDSASKPTVPDKELEPKEEIPVPSTENPPPPNGEAPPPQGDVPATPDQDGEKAKPNDDSKYIYDQSYSALLVRDKLHPCNGAMGSANFLISKSILLEVNNDKRCIDLVKKF